MIRNKASRISAMTAALGAALLLGGCAGPNPRDPFESYNRAAFKFNDTVDEYALKPVATAYKDIVPGFVQTGVGNFFGNLNDAWSAINALLQGKGEAGMSDLMRFSLNSTLGIAGLIDIASEAGIKKYKEDFGQTLGYWGVDSGPYLVLPILGPSTVRDTVALPVDIAGDIWRYKEPTYLRNIGTGIRVIDTRAQLLDASSLLEDAALDRYEFLRDGYLQRRQSQIDDGGESRKPKQDKDEDDAKPAAKPTASLESYAPVSSETPPKELNSGAPAAANASL
ncbi:VacJ family lipoprotein [Oxalobacteraceae bacterium A2-2]